MSQTFGIVFQHVGLTEYIATALDTSDVNIKTQEKVSASYVPSHLHHIMFEIFKV